MSDKDLIRELQSAQEPSRKTDTKLASLAGWEKVPEDGAEQKQHWVFPGESRPRLPMFTSSVDAAMEFASLIAPNEPIALVRSGDQCSAVVGNGPHCFSRIPAIALCLAALRSRHG